MKKIWIVLIATGLCVTSAFSQDSIYQAVNKETCSCITEKSRFAVGIKEYHDCVKLALQKHMNLLLAQLKMKNADSTYYYQKGLSYGRAIGSRLDTDLVYTCDAYFKIADTIRASVFRVSNTDSLRQELVNLNNPANTRDYQFYRRRSITYFLLGMIDEANSDDEEVLKQQPQNIAGLLIHAIYLENHASYLEAAAIFYQLDKITGEHAYLVSAAINNRKNRESDH
jgi:hypothetical protein